MRENGRKQFQKWLDDRGVKQSFAAMQMDISYAHLNNWLAGRDGLSAKAGLKIEAYTGGEVKMIDCILPGWERIPLYIWGRGKMTLREYKRGSLLKSKSFWEL